MRLDRFDLNLLVVLDALLEERNVTRASERLHIGQSAASGALARLREYFGDELLVPVGRRMVLTPLAESLVAPVRDTVLRARATLALKPGFDPATAERRFTVCASDYVTTVLLAAAVRRIAVEAPGLALEILHPPKGVEESFERGGIDLLVMPRQFLAQHSHPRAELFQDSHACLVWQGNTAVGEALTLDRYMAMQHVSAKLGDERSVSFEDWLLQRFGQKRRIAVSFDGFAMLPLLLVGTHRIATLHRRLAEHCATQLPLRLLDTPFEMPALVEVMQWHRHMDGDPAHAWLRRVLLECAAAMAPSPTPME